MGQTNETATAEWFTALLFGLALLSQRGRVFTHSQTKVSTRGFIFPLSMLRETVLPCPGGKNPEQLRIENTNAFYDWKTSNRSPLFLWTLIVFRKRKIYNISTKQRRPISNICKRAPYVYKIQAALAMRRAASTHTQMRVKQLFLGSAHSAAHTHFSFSHFDIFIDGRVGRLSFIWRLHSRTSRK